MGRHKKEKFRVPRFVADDQAVVGLDLGPFTRAPSCVRPLVKGSQLPGYCSLGSEFWPRICQYMPWDGTQYPSSNFGMVHVIPVLNSGWYMIYQYMMGYLRIYQYMP